MNDQREMTLDEYLESKLPDSHLARRQLQELRDALAALAVQGEPESSGLYAVYLRDNWDGEGDTYWILARKQDNGAWVSEDSGKELIEHEGDALLKVVPLVAAPQPAEQRCDYCDGTGDVHSIDGEWRGTCSCPAGRQPAPVVAALVEALYLALEYWRDRQQRYKNRRPKWVVAAELALAAYRKGGE